MTVARQQGRALPRVICVSGIDGSGKSTLVDWIADRARDAGQEPVVLWLRFNHVLTKPLLALCRLIGLTRYEVVDGIRVGYHDFFRSRLVAWTFVLLQYVDALRVRWFCIGPKLGDPRKVLILDRYVYDILVDLGVDTRLAGLCDNWAGRWFNRLLPRGAVCLHLIRGKEELLEARPEAAVDDNFPLRLRLYEALVDRQEVITIRNDEDLATLYRRVAGVLVDLA